jgi:hypothetical protein
MLRASYITTARAIASLTADDPTLVFTRVQRAGD